MSNKYPTIRLPDEGGIISFNRHMGILITERGEVHEYTRVPRSQRLRTEVFPTGLVSMCFINGVSIRLEIRFNKDSWPDMIEWLTLWWSLGRKGAE